MQFNYYYGSEAEQFNFIKVPKMMIKDAAFDSLSLVSKLLYGLLLDRMNLSMKNKWFDDENRVYIIYQISEIMDDLNVSKRKAIEYLQELEQFGLVEKKRRGFGLPSLLYVKNFIFKNEQLNRGAQSDTSRSSQTGTSRSAKSVTSRSAFRELTEESDRAPQNNNKENYINMNNSYSYPINEHNENGMSDWMDEINIYMDYLAEHLEIDLLCERYPNDKESIIGMKDLVLEILVCKNDTIQIAGNEFPTQVVKSRFMKLDSSHIEYVLSCMKSNTTKVGNIKKYLLASLFNAPVTMHSFYQAEFNHDIIATFLTLNSFPNEMVARPLIPFSGFANLLAVTLIIIFLPLSFLFSATKCSELISVFICTVSTGRIPLSLKLNKERDIQKAMLAK